MTRRTAFYDGMLIRIRLCVVWLGAILSMVFAGDGPDRWNFGPHTPMPHLASYPGATTCSEFVTVFPTGTARENGYARPETLLLQCNEENTGSTFGFTAFELECGTSAFQRTIRNNSGGSTFGSKLRQTFTVATTGKVRLLKSFVDGERGYVIAILERRHSIIYTISYEETKSRLRFQAIKLQDIRHAHLTDVDIIRPPRGRPFIAFSAYNADVTDRSRQYESVAPVYRFGEKHLEFCSYAPVIRSVAVRGWVQQGVVMLVYASYTDSESEKSQLNFFGVDLYGDDASYDCQVQPREIQPLISAINGKVLYGIQSMEAIHSNFGLHLVVALNPLDCQANCGTNAFADSFILQPDVQKKSPFDTTNVMRFPGSTSRFNGFTIVEADCGLYLIGYGILSTTRLFTLEWPAQAAVLGEVPAAMLPSSTTGSSLGYCHREPIITLTRPDALGVSTHWMNCDALSPPDVGNFFPGPGPQDYRLGPNSYDSFQPYEPPNRPEIREREGNRVPYRNFARNSDMYYDPNERPFQPVDRPDEEDQSDKWSAVRSYKLQRARYEAETSTDRRRLIRPDREFPPERTENPETRFDDDSKHVLPVAMDKTRALPPASAISPAGNSSRPGASRVPLKNATIHLPRPIVLDPANPNRNGSQPFFDPVRDERASFNRPFNGSLHPLRGLPPTIGNWPMLKQKPREPDGKIMFRPMPRSPIPVPRNFTLGPRYAPDPQQPPRKNEQFFGASSLRGEVSDLDYTEREVYPERRGSNRMDQLDPRQHAPPWDPRAMPPRHFRPPEMVPRFP